MNKQENLKKGYRPLFTSMRDNEVIEIANKHSIVMVFMGMRHFKYCTSRFFLKSV